MEILEELQIVLKLLLAFVLGGLIGFDRERKGKSAGIRTYAAVCLGASLFTDIAQNFHDTAATSRIIAYIISGIGFLGGGIIFKDASTSNSYGLTTAATVWCTAGVGVAVGMNMFIIGIVSAAAVYFLLALDQLPWYVRWRNKIQQKKPGNNRDE